MKTASHCRGQGAEFRACLGLSRFDSPAVYPRAQRRRWLQSLAQAQRCRARAARLAPPTSVSVLKPLKLPAARWQGAGAASEAKLWRRRNAAARERRAFRTASEVLAEAPEATAAPKQAILDLRGPQACTPIASSSLPCCQSHVVHTAVSMQLVTLGEM